MDATFPKKLEFLFSPGRYKVMHGGRGSSKSWSAARALLIKGTQEPLNILCTRELQNSIEESVHKLLSQQIRRLELDWFYTIEKRHIYGQNGTVFSFEGIARNVDKIRSFEGVDICWVEEAHKVSRNSWLVLIPTIRKDGSEIWVTFNPELETDETYQRFVVNPPESALVAEVNWRDNPWFPQVLMEEMLALKERDYDEYLWVWEGKCKQVLEGAIYAKELRRAEAEGRITTVPYERNHPVDLFFDLGRRDMTSIWFVQKIDFKWHVIDFFEDRLEELDYYIRELRGREYLYEHIYLPHDAKRKVLEAKLSTRDRLKKSGLVVPANVHVVKKLGLSDANNLGRKLMDSAYFDRSKTQEGLNHLRRYQYSVGDDGQFSLSPLHNEHSHAADSWRTGAVGLIGPRKVELNLGSAVENFLTGLGEDTPQGQNWMRG